jgi:transcriptional regulator with XRE-family HTH domain
MSKIITAVPSEVAWDAEGFYEALDKARTGRGLSWAEVARQTGVLHSTLNRLSARHSGNVETIARLMLWMGRRDIGEFLT